MIISGMYTTEVSKNLSKVYGALEKSCGHISGGRVCELDT